jgi:hypothetical protein
MPKGGRFEHEEERDNAELAELLRAKREETRADEELERYKARVAPCTAEHAPFTLADIERIADAVCYAPGQVHRTADLAGYGLPTDALRRKDTPIFSGVLRYFPLALAAVAQCSKVGNDQHNPGEPLHWAREKSTDEGDALVRHQLEVGARDTDGIRHATKVAWRALAQLQKEIEADGGAL